MRHLLLISLIIVSSSCSLWPWKSEKTGTCLDDDSCQNADPLTQELIGGTWYCYGSDPEQSWDCSQTSDNEKIVQIPAERTTKEIQREQSESRLVKEDREMQNDFQSQDAVLEDKEKLTLSDLSSFPDESYAVQLIALQTEEEIEKFKDTYNIPASITVMIRSQGVDWYVVILGVFDDLDQAEIIANEWQATHKPKSKPWVRSLGSLKQVSLAR